MNHDTAKSDSESKAIIPLGVGKAVFSAGYSIIVWPNGWDKCNLHRQSKFYHQLPFQDRQSYRHTWLAVAQFPFLVSLGICRKSTNVSDES